MSWSALPIELILRILTFCDPVELVEFRRVNSFCKSLIDETTTFQYRIALFASGMEDGPPGERTTSERLNLLKSYEASWRNVAWTEDNTILSPRGVVWEFYGNVWAHSRESDSLDFVQLPSRLRGIPMRQWTLKFDFAVRDFGIDSSQDLLVTIENFRNAPNLSRIRLLTLSTGENHPLARSTAVVEHTLTAPEAPEDIHNRWSHSIRICGDYVGILFMERFIEHHGYGRRSELVVWCWRTAVRKLKVLSANLRSFAFLGDYFILGSTLEPPSLLVYCLEPRPQTRANQHFLRFRFGAAFQHVSDILLASDPSPAWSSNTGLQVPFQIAGDERMIATNLQFFDEQGIHQCETSLIPTKPFLKYIETFSTKDENDVNWEHHAPLLSERVPGHAHWDIWTCFIFGMRYIVPRVIHLHGKPMVIIRDFCARRYLRASKEEHEESNSLYQVLTAGPRRREPYLRSILKSVPVPESIEVLHNAKLMISEDGIVILEATFEGHSRVHLLTF